jgi:hypothetical protein
MSRTVPRRRLPDRRLPSPSTGPWLRDAPLDLGTDRDALGVEGLVSRLADLISEGMPPFAIALSGGWGVGKSTIARTLVSRLRTKRIPAVYVDAWTEDIANLRRSLVIAVAAATRFPKKREEELELRRKLAADIDDELATTETKHGTGLLGDGWRRRVGRLVEGLGLAGLTLLGVLVAMTLMIAIRTPDPFFGFAQQVLVLLVAFVLFHSGRVFPLVSRSRGPTVERILIEREFRKVAAQQGDGKGGRVERIAVVVDNLDRLPGDEAIKALGEIRSLIDFEDSACVFIVPVDRMALTRHVAAALGGQSPQSVGAESQAAARDYLDKFFNLDVPVTDPAPVDVRELAQELAHAVLPRRSGDEEDFRLAVQIAAHAARSSPRKAKRILNGVATRAKLIGRPTGASLAQIALIESALVLVPRLAETLAQEPRRLSRVMERLRADPDTSTTAADFGLAAGSDEDLERVRSLLIEFRDVDLDVRTTRLVLALREDGRWRGVADPEPVEMCLQSGDPNGFGAIMEDLPPQAARVALERACEWIVQGAPAFPRDFANGLVAVVRYLDTLPRLATRMREMAWSVYAMADDETVSRVTPDVAEFLFPAAASGGRTTSAALRFASVLSARVGSNGPPGPGLIRAAQLAAAHIDDSARIQLKQSLAGLTDDLLTPFFEPVVDRDLVGGPVLQMYLDRAATIELSGENHEANVVALQRLATCLQAGLDFQVDLISSRLFSQLAATPSDLSDAALDVLRTAADLFSAARDRTEDQLALALARRIGTRRGEYMSLALGMPVSAPTSAELANYLRSWLASSEASPDAVETLLCQRIDLVRSLDPEWASHLLARWVPDSDKALLQLVARFGNSEERRQIVRYPARSSSSPPARFREVVELLRDDPAALQDLVAEIANWVAIAPLPQVSELGPTLVALAQSGVGVDGVPEGLWARAEATADRTELAQLVQAVKALELNGWTAPADTITRLLNRSVAIGLDDATSAGYFLEHSLGQEVTSLIVRAIRNPATSVDAALDLWRKRSRNAAIGAAVVARAASPGTAEQDARRLLEAALRSPRPSRNERQDYETSLSEIATRYPSLDKLVVELRSRL